MGIFGYHSSHEQFTPSQLRDYLQLAEKAGFNSAMSSDHFNPWSENQGQSGNTWAWLGAALQATSLNISSLAIPGGNRYHPALLAQTVATLADLFPSRIPWLAAGSGEAMNETFIDRHWPAKTLRQERLKEGVDIMRALWRGEVVDRPEGPLPTYEAQLWSLPKNLPKIYIAALTPETATWAAGWAEGLATVNQDRKSLERMVRAFHSGGGIGKPMALQIHVSWDKSLEKAKENALHQWKNNSSSDKDLADLRTTADFDRHCQGITLKQVEEKVLISVDRDEYIAKAREILELGFSEIYFHNVGRNQEDFIKFFGNEVLPKI